MYFHIVITMPHLMKCRYEDKTINYNALIMPIINTECEKSKNAQLHSIFFQNAFPIGDKLIHALEKMI